MGDFCTRGADAQAVISAKQSAKQYHAAWVLILDLLKETDC